MKNCEKVWARSLPHGASCQRTGWCRSSSGRCRRRKSPSWNIGAAIRWAPLRLVIPRGMTMFTFKEHRNCGMVSCQLTLGNRWFSNLDSLNDQAFFNFYKTLIIFPLKLINHATHRIWVPKTSLLQIRIPKIRDSWLFSSWLFPNL